MTSVWKKALSHPEVYPLLGIVGFPGAFAVFCGTRACLRYPDLIWNHNSNPEPWSDIKQTDQRKMYQTYDYTSTRKELPKPPTQ